MIEYTTGTMGIIIVRKVLKDIVNSTTLFFQDFQDFIYFYQAASDTGVFYMWCCIFSL